MIDQKKNYIWIFTQKPANNDDDDDLQFFSLHSFQAISIDIETRSNENCCLWMSKNKHKYLLKVSEAQKKCDRFTQVVSQPSSSSQVSSVFTWFFVNVSSYELNALEQREEAKNIIWDKWMCNRILWQRSSEQADDKHFLYRIDQKYAWEFTTWWITEKIYWANILFRSLYKSFTARITTILRESGS